MSVARRCVRGLVVLALLGVIGLAVHPLVQTLRAAHHFRRAEQALAVEDLDDAGAHLAVCLALGPDEPRYHFLAARTARCSGLYDLAAEHLEAYRLRAGRTAALQLEQYMLRFQRGERIADTERLLWEAVDQDDPDAAFILEALARGYVRSYRLRDALRALDEWLRRQPGSVRARLQRGWVCERLDRVDDAENTYRDILTDRPEREDAVLRLGLLLLQRGRPAQALPWFEQLRDSPAERLAVQVGLARCHADLGRTEDAIRLLDGLLADYPREPAVLLERGKLALHAGDLDRAETWLRQAAALAPHDYPTRYQLFLCLRKRGAETEARQQEKELAALGRDLNQMNELTQALYDRPNDVDLRYRIGRLFLRRGEAREGLLWLNGVLQLDPEHAAAHRALADYYESRGDRQRAAEHRRHVAGLRTDE